MKQYIIAVDFDGFLFKEAYPEIGKPIMKNINFVKKLKKQGHIIILNTCRTGLYEIMALLSCRDYNLIFDYVNENTPERIALFDGDCRKISADIYLDDRAYNNIDDVKERFK